MRCSPGIAPTSGSGSRISSRRDASASSAGSCAASTESTARRRSPADLRPPIVRERRDKLGFVTPERIWLRGKLGELAGDVFSSRSFAERGFVDAHAARRRLERHRRGEVEAGMELWRALNLELWARAFLSA